MVFQRSECGAAECGQRQECNCYVNLWNFWWWGKSLSSSLFLTPHFATLQNYGQVLYWKKTYIFHLAFQISRVKVFFSFADLLQSYRVCVVIYGQRTEDMYIRTVLCSVYGRWICRHLLAEHIEKQTVWFRWAGRRFTWHCSPDWPFTGDTRNMINLYLMVRLSSVFS